jgi:hypothetical protein
MCLSGWGSAEYVSSEMPLRRPDVSIIHMQMAMMATTTAFCVGYRVNSYLAVDICSGHSVSEIRFKIVPESDRHSGIPG